MTVADLVKELQKFPDDTIVAREGGEYQHDYRQVGSVSQPHAGTRANPHSYVVID